LAECQKLANLSKIGVNLSLVFDSILRDDSFIELGELLEFLTLIYKALLAFNFINLLRLEIRTTF
jgi:hypothetical protein